MKYANITVVIPCYKSGNTVRRAVESVYNQTMLPKEVVLVDDCSPDNTLVILKELQQKYPNDWIKVVALNENVGAGSARNRGWDCATQEYIAFLDSDDSWHPEKIEIQYQWMSNNPHASLTAHSFEQLEDENELLASILAYRRIDTFMQLHSRTLLLSNKLATPTVVLKRDLPFRFKENKRYSEDYQLWLEIILSGYKCFISDDKLAFSYKDPYGEGGLSANLWEMQKGELDTYLQLRKKNFLGFHQMIFYQTFSLIKFVKRSINVFLKKIIYELK